MFWDLKAADIFQCPGGGKVPREGQVERVRGVIVFSDGASSDVTSAGAPGAFVWLALVTLGGELEHARAKNAMMIAPMGLLLLFGGCSFDLGAGAL